MKISVALQLLIAALVFALVAAPAAQAASTVPATAEAKVAAKEKADEPTAAERRAADSEFEREKLDQGAFDRAEEERSEESSGSGGGSGSVMRALLGLVVVLGAIFGIHWLLKRWGQSRLQGVAGTAGVIDVVATTPLAQGRALHLVRVGEGLVLVGATDQSITRIGDVDAGVLGAQVAGGPSSGGSSSAEFQAMLSGAMLGNQPGVPNGMGGAGSAQQPFIKRFLDNLRMTTAR